MSNFDIALKITLQHEGGYSNYSDDPETIFGISREAHPKSLIWKELDNYKEILKPFDDSKKEQLETLCKNNAIIQKEVETIYKEQYWYKVRGDYIDNQANANVLFDMAVNAGVSKAVKLAQALVGTDVDGICGNKTTSAINTYGVAFCNAYVNERIIYYESLNKPKYIKGWTNRANSFKV